VSDEWNQGNVLANLAVRVGQLEGVIKTFMERWKDQDDAAVLGRRITQEKVELLSMQIERLANDLRGVQQDIAELKNEIDEEIMPTMQTTQFARERKAGARGVWALVGGAVLAAASAVTYIADKALSYLIPKP
jgi:lipid II:glycine glycyltransferase (peptidoglycan interpeptide bridge formation enzyme)